MSLHPSPCLLGGYETGGTKRLPLIYQTILSGDLDQSHDLDNDGISDILNNPTNVSDHLVVLAESPGTTTIDGIIFTLAEVSINRCAFKGNRGNNGGAVSIRGPVSTFIANSQFSGNVAGFRGFGSRGGALYINRAVADPGNPGASDEGPLEIRSCTFVRNKANDEGGGLYMAGAGSRSIVYSIFYLNTVAGVEFTDDIIFAQSFPAPLFRHCYSSTDGTTPGETNFDWIDDAPTFVEFFALTQNGVNPDSTP